MWSRNFPIRINFRFLKKKIPWRNFQIFQFEKNIPLRNFPDSVVEFRILGIPYFYFLINFSIIKTALPQVAEFDCFKQKSWRLYYRLGVLRLQE